MRFVEISDLKVGQKIMKDVYTNYGTLIIPARTVINEYIIDKLYNIGIKGLYIDDTDEEIKEERKRAFKQAYDKSVDGIKKIMDGIRYNDRLRISDVGDVVEILIHQMLNQPSILSRLSELKSQDDYTYRHSINVSIISVLIGKWMGYGQDRLKQISYGALLHDIGKSKIPLEILNKPGPLTNDEFEEMKKHTIYGYQMAEKISGLNNNIRYIILSHHEREDGTGYPLGLMSYKIPEYAKITAVADIYDAMTSERVYKRRMNPYSVLRHIMDGGFSNLNPQIVQVFIRNISNLFIGSTVKLSNDISGEIIFVNPNLPTRPVVKANDTYFDLSEDFSINIVDVIE